MDYIITHCSPSSIQDTFSGGLFRRDALTDFLDEVREHCQFQYWFFGHYHENMVVEKKFVMLYKQIIRLKKMMTWRRTGDWLMCLHFLFK